MTTPPPGSPPEPSDRPEPGYPPSSYPPPGYPAQSYPAPNQPAGPPGYQNYPGGADPYAGGPSGDDPLVARDFGGWFQRIIGVIKRSFPRLAILATINALVSAVLGALLASLAPTPATPSGVPFDPSATVVPPQVSPGDLVTIGVVSLIGVVVSLVVNAFVQGASIFVAVREADGRPAEVADGLRFATGRVLPLIGWGILGGFLVLIGLLLLVVPGIYLLVVVTALLPAVVVIERGNLGRCFRLIKNRWWATFGRLLVAAIIGGVYYGIVALIAHAVGGPVVAAIVQALLLVPLSVAMAAFIVVTYAEVRSHQPEGATTGMLAAQLEH